MHRWLAMRLVRLWDRSCSEELRLGSTRNTVSTVKWGGSAGKTLFSEKVALTKDVQYDGVKNGPAWKLTTSNYFISKAPDLEHILQLIE